MNSEHEGTAAGGGKKKKFDINIKVITIGDKAVGKTCLIASYFEDKFLDQTLSTLNVVQKSKMLTMEDKKVKY